ncbi:MAG TPA: putative porin [Steroidobacteraceae bacterium]
MKSSHTRVFRTLLSALTLVCAPLVSHADEKQSLEELRNTVINLLQALVDEGVITKEKAQQMVKAAQDKAAADAAALAKSDEGAVRVPYVPQIVKDEIAKQVAEEVKPQVVAGVVQEAKAEKWGVPGALADWLTRTRIYGEVTVREEGLFYDSNNAHDQFPNYYAINQAGSIAKSAAALTEFLDDNEQRVRFRGRARFGVESNLTDSISTGMRIVTGNTTDLVSETQTVDGSAPYQFGLDELYIRLDERNLMRFPWLTAVVGRFLNPYENPTNLIFHRDLTFTGAAITGRLGLGDGTPEQSNLFLTIGGHQLQEIQFSADDKWLVAAQLGAQLRWGEAQHLRVAGGYYDYFNVTGRLNPPGSPGLYNYTAPQFLRYGNTVFDIANAADPTSNLFALASKFRLGDVNAVYGIGVGRYELSMTADAVKNFGYNTTEVAANVGYAVPANRNMGYQAEFGFGYPTISGPGAWRGVVGYRFLQNDAVIDGFTDSDFHYFGGTNAKGYYVTGEVGLASGLWLRVRYMSANEVDGPHFGVDTLQFDLNARF